MRSHVLRNALLAGRDDARDGHRRSRSAARSSPRRSTACPGSGRWRSRAHRDFDLPTMQGIIVFATLAIIVFNLFVDLLYASIDPRIRLSLDGTAV